MKLIPNWQEQGLTCERCGSKKSVKYRTTLAIVDSVTLKKVFETEICVCNKCALLFSKQEVHND